MAYFESQQNQTGMDTLQQIFQIIFLTRAITSQEKQKEAFQLANGMERRRYTTTPTNHVMTPLELQSMIPSVHTSSKDLASLPVEKVALWYKKHTK